MHSFDTTFRAKLMKRIVETVEDQKGQLAGGFFRNGKSPEHVAMDYSERVGYIRALHEVEAMMEDVAKEMMES